MRKIKFFIKRNMRILVISALLTGIVVVPTSAFFGLFGPGFIGGNVFDVTRYAKNKAWVVQIKSSLERMGIKIDVLDNIVAWSEKNVEPFFKKEKKDIKPKEEKNKENEIEKVQKTGKDLPGMNANNREELRNDFEKKWFKAFGVTDDIEATLSKEEDYLFSIQLAAAKEREKKLKLVEGMQENVLETAGERANLQLANTVNITRAKSKADNLREKLAGLRYESIKEEADKSVTAIAEAKKTKTLGIGLAPDPKTEKEMKKAIGKEEKRRPVARFET